MATQKSTTAQKSAGRRPGRPSNASKAAAVHSQQSMLIDVAIAAASAAVKSAFGIIDGGVSTIAQPQGGQSVGSTSQGSGTQSTSQGTQTTTRTTSRSSGQGRKAPGRKVDGTSNMSLTRQFYAENLKSANPLNRADFVRAAAEKFNYNKQIANTYVSNIEKEGGYLLQRRGGNSASRTPSKRRTSAKGSNQNQNQNQTQAQAA